MKVRHALAALAAAAVAFAGAFFYRPSEPVCEITLQSVTPGLAKNVAELMLELPFQHSLEVRVVPLRQYGILGYAEPGDVYGIYLDSELSEQELWDVLVHEWAHLRAWDLGLPEGEDVHGATWGRAYSEVYLALLD